MLRGIIDKNVILIILLLWLAVLNSSNADISPGASVVRITVKSPSGTDVGSGFAWSSPTYIVTALHVVAGAKKITVYSESKQNKSNATIVSALLEPDLALLKLDKDIGLSPLVHARANMNSKEDHFIWGYPHDVSAMTRHKVGLVGGLSTDLSLKSIFKNQNQFKRAVGVQGYPALGAKILRIDKIQPGHSGAPIVNQSGGVIGIGDGGLRDGLGGLNWAIRASTYLPKLINSNDKIPTGRSAQSTLFNISNGEKPIVLGRNKSNYVLKRVWVDSLQDIIEKMQDDDMREIYETYNKISIEDADKSLSNAIINVYEDMETGATFAIPEGIDFNYSESEKLLTVQARDKGPKMIVQVVENDTWQAGLDNLNNFSKALLLSSPRWEKDSSNPDEFEAEPENNYALQSLYRWIPQASGEQEIPVAEMEALMMIDDNDFLGTSVVALDQGHYSNIDWYNFYLMLVCAGLADFDS